MGLTFVNIIQALGAHIPLIGVIVLLHKQKTKVSTHLLLTNIGCLFMNCAYILLLNSRSYEEAMMAYKIQYLSNVWFYFFFGLFAVSFVAKKYPRWPFYIWGALELAGVLLIWNDYSGMILESISFMHDARWGFNYLEIIPGPLYMIRLCIISFVLLGSLIYTTIKIFLAKVNQVRYNLARLAGSQFIVILSLVLMLLGAFKYDIVPLFSSLSILAIILSVYHDEFLGIAEMGREWVLEQMEEAVIIVDSVYSFLDANAFAKSIFPQLETQEVGKRISDDIGRLFVQDGVGVEIGDRYYQKKAVAIRQKNRVVGRSLLLVDMTQQRQLCSDLNAEKIKADEANEAKSAFLSSMSHEIRTPMNAIVGITDIMLRRDLSEQDKEYLNNIKSSGNALLTIINDILDFSKIESGKMELVCDEYEPMSMLSDLGMLFLNRIGDKSVELLFDIDANLPARLHGDVLRLRQVIINIVNNAIKFTDEGYVKLSIKVHSINDDEVELFFSVKDTGQGIEEGNISKIFSTYQQVDEKKNKYKEGTGLGLSISQKFVEMMGGKIGVKSKYGEGSEFYFTVIQKLVDGTKAARVKKTDGIIVSAIMDNILNLQTLKSLCMDYGVRFEDMSTLADTGEVPEFVFVDEAHNACRISEMACDCNTTVCLLQNPMRDSAWNCGAVVVNKPLYSLNFCNTLNREVSENSLQEDKTLGFIAPNARILVVDDNEMNLKVAMGLLEPLQMKIETADNGKLALDKIKHNHYDLIFMDHMMPIMDGVEATITLRSMDDEYCRTVPVIALTANAVTDAREQFVRAGMNDFVAKPIKLKEICAKIKKWLPEELVQEAGAIFDEADADIELPTIEGIDAREGVKNSGTPELFFSLLGDFYKLIDMKSVKIEKCLADGLIRDYTIEVHALKNTARMIGAMELSALSAHMEQCGNSGETQTLIKETPRLLELYRSYKEILKPYAMNQERDKREADREEVISLLDGIENAIDSFNLDAADGFMREIETIRFDDECIQLVEQLGAYLADVAMEEVMDVCRQLKQMI